jgi:hypothetical protein
MYLTDSRTHAITSFIFCRTQPKQFATWWKNNIERKAKFKMLQNDASLAEDEKDIKTIQRVNYCQNAIAIALSVRHPSHFHAHPFHTLSLPPITVFPPP